MESEAKAAVQTHYSEILVAVEQMDAGADAQDSVLRVTRLSSLQQDDNWPMAFIPWTGDHTEIMIDTVILLSVTLNSDDSLFFSEQVCSCFRVAILQWMRHQRYS